MSEWLLFNVGVARRPCGASLLLVGLIEASKYGDHSIPFSCNWMQKWDFYVRTKEFEVF